MPDGTEPAVPQTGGTRRQKDMRKALRQIAPRIPLFDAQAVLSGAMAGHLRHLPPSIAVQQALTSHIRHTATEYDTLLAEGYDRDSARHFVLDDINDQLADWGSGLRIAEADVE
ncbi:DUF2293 domain-containing protein [Pannonibacter sp. Pt2]|uniref:DUF2293 domain-containing protein n=1 Tax=Pannonibacter anstelovis TaxID=3121537 RepID=A0ABU7ZSZ7_9HYPH